MQYELSMLRKFLVGIASFAFIAGCYVQSDPIEVQDADAGSIVPKTCWTPKAMYAVNFKLKSGNCPNVDDKVSYQWMNADGTLDIPSYCVEHGNHSACTSWINEKCTTWAYYQNLSGELNWNPGGQSAQGLLTFTAIERYTGIVFCSSVYYTTYDLQWQADDGR